jgi:hypothetical protein
MLWLKPHVLSMMNLDPRILDGSAKYFLSEHDFAVGQVSGFSVGQRGHDAFFL